MSLPGGPHPALFIRFEIEHNTCWICEGQTLVIRCNACHGTKGSALLFRFVEEIEVRIDG